MPSIALQKAISTAIAMMAVAFIAYFLIYIKIGSELYSNLNAILSYFSGKLGIPDNFIKLPVLVFATLLISPSINFLFRLFIGKSNPGEIFLFFIVCLLFVVAWNKYTEGWYFGINGEPITFVCPEAFPGAGLRIQSERVDHLLGGVCEPISSEKASRIQQIKHSNPPKLISLTSENDVRALERFDKYGPKLLAGAPAFSGDAPLLYLGRGGIDPRSGKPLLPATDADISRVIESLREKPHEVNDSSSTDSSKVSTSEMKYSDQPSSIQPLNLHSKYFRHALDNTAPLVIILESNDDEIKKSASGALSDGEWWGEDTLNSDAFIKQVATPIFNNPYRPLSRDIFPPGLHEFIVAKINYKMSNSKWCITVVRFDVINWEATKFNTSIEI